MNKNKLNQTLELIQKKGIMRPKDLKKHGIPQDYLWELSKQGQIIKLSRGVYAASYEDITAHHSFAIVSKQVPKGIICLLSALQFHELTTQLPFEVWLAIENKAHQPRIEDMPLRIIRMSGQALNEGIETYNIEGVNVQVYSVAKTIADCFKFRNKIGIDVAIEALKDGLEKKKSSRKDIHYFAKICRVQNVMSPYMEALI